jgi:hypothetical protein
MHNTWHSPAQFPQARADDVGHGAADASVDLVENERLARRIVDASVLRRQHQPRQLAA